MKRIPVRDRTGVVAYAVVDDVDYEHLRQFRWSFRGTRRGVKRRYVGRRDPSRKGGIMLMHREIMGMKIGDRRQVDHRDGNPLNNRRCNLRTATNAQNLQNQSPRSGTSSRFRGVGWSKFHGKWRAYGTLNGKLHHLGYHTSEVAAAAVSAEWRRKNMPFTEERQ